MYSCVCVCIIKVAIFFFFFRGVFSFLTAIYKSRSQRPKITSTKSHAKVLGQYAIKFWPNNSSSNNTNNNNNNIRQCRWSCKLAFGLGNIACDKWERGGEGEYTERDWSRRDEAKQPFLKRFVLIYHSNGNKTDGEEEAVEARRQERKLIAC